MSQPDPDNTAIKKLPDKIVGKIGPAQGSIYEVIIKFHRDGRAVIEAFLLAHMVSVTVSQTENSNILLAYCQFQGDIKALDDKLAALRQSAMVVLGDREEKFLDFFVALRQLSRPLPRLLTSGQGSTLPSFLRLDWIKGFMVALALFAVWQGVHFASSLISRLSNQPPASSVAPTPTVAQWAPYVLPQYHQAWLEVRKKHKLSDATLLSLFRTIKAIDRYGPAHHLRDLTIYPSAIDRALGIVILKGVGDSDALRNLNATLQSYSANWKSLPDRGAASSLSLDNSAFEDQVVLTFYEQILKDSRREFTERLIRELRRNHLTS